ncbi:MAG: DUF4214 domain-containing protein, partial [Clostridiales bacterium]|nr:DUF4214 domain-containing protein [Clostridiales bacterium]
DTDIVMSVTPPEYDGTYSYKWYRKNYSTGEYEELAGETSSSLTAGSYGDSFRCGIIRNGVERSVEFYLTYSGRERPSMSGISQSLGNAGQATTALVPPVAGSVHYCACSGYYSWQAYMNNNNPWNVQNTIPMSDTNNVSIPGFNVTTVDYSGACEDYYSNVTDPYYWYYMSYYYPYVYNYFPISTYHLAFVRSEDNTDTISVGDAKTVSLDSVVLGENDYPGLSANGMIYPECMVYTFTPEHSGTYTLASSDILTGDPYVALFNSDLCLVDYMDNLDGTHFFDNASVPPVSYSAPADGTQPRIPDRSTNSNNSNFSYTEHLYGGETYYYVVWSSKTLNRNSISEGAQIDPMAQFGITLTCVELDSFNVNVTSSGHGTASASVASAAQGTAVTLTATPDSGYRFASWEVISGGVTVNNNSFTIGNSDVQIRANFEVIPTTAPTTPAPTTPTPAIPDNGNNTSVSEGGVSGFVERLYTIALGRNSDPVGKQDWIDAITLRGETGAGAARGFLFSPEFLNKQCTNEEFVATLYRTFFNREPDQAGFNAWVAALNNGTPKQEIIEGFINSTEWANLCLFYGIRSGGTGVPNVEIEPNAQTIAFATRLYTTCLGRNADQNGLMAWARQLANQRDTGSGAAHGFFFSDEFINQNVSNSEFVTRLYRTFMDREPDQSGFDAWVAQLDGGISREEVFNGFAQSPEFARICAAYGIIR